MPWVLEKRDHRSFHMRHCNHIRSFSTQHMHVPRQYRRLCLFTLGI